jgi:magnesium transporter
MEIKKNKSVRWIDVARPSLKDLNFLEKEFGLHPIIVGELKGPSARARVESYKGYLYFIYYFPLYDAEDATSVRSEIDFVVTKNAVITVHYESLGGAFKELGIADAKNSLELMHGIIEHLINFEERQLRHIREKVEAVSKEIFKGKEKEVLERITHLKRDISEYRISVRLQEPILKSLYTKGIEFWGNDAEVYLNDLIGEQLKIVNQVQDYRETISDFEDTNNQLMNVKISNAMKTFTALSFLTFPFVLLAGVFSMRVADIPLVDTPHAFWIIVGAMLVCMLTLIVYFKRKGWF